MKKGGFVGQPQPQKPGAQPVVGRDGRMEAKPGLRIQEVAKAFELLHSDDPESEEKLAAMLQHQ